MTSTTGDKGVDLIAAKNGYRYALQCKLHSKTVGVSAVQEVSAGARFYVCDFAVVVAENGYTPASVDLARTLSVGLISKSGLPDLEELF